MSITLKSNLDGSADIMNGLNTAIAISPTGKISANGLQGYNYIINGNFDVWQRGTSQAVSGYGSDDRWVNSNYGATTKTHSKQPFAVGEAFPDGVICPPYFSRTTVNSVVGVANAALKTHKIESVRTLTGKKAVLSFYAKADASKNLAIELAQVFGTGGSPSGAVLSIGTQKIALTSVWQRFSITYDIPSVANKVLGTNNDDYLSLQFWFDAGSNFNSRTASLGHQSGTFDIACVSLVEGDVDVKPIPRSYGEELALCQRYYQRVGLYGGGVSLNSNAHRVASSTLVVDMRNTPTLELISPTYTNCSGGVVQWIGYYNTIGVYVYPPSSGVLMVFTAGATLDAEL